MKKVITAVAAMVMVFMSTMGAFAQDYDYNINVQIDGKALEFTDAKPFLSVAEGRTLLPVRVISENMGADVKWDADARTATITKGSDKIEMKIGDRFAVKNGKRVWFDVESKIMDNRTYLPIRAVAEMLGCDVSWNASKRLVSIDTHKDVKTVAIEQVLPDLKNFFLGDEVKKAMYVSPSEFELGWLPELQAIHITKDKGIFGFVYIKDGKIIGDSGGYSGENNTWNYYIDSAGMTPSSFDQIGLYRGDTIYIFDNPCN